MFSEKNQKSKTVVAPEKLNRIVEGTVIEGEIRSESSIRIDGKVLGATSTKGKLVVGSTGSIDGEVTCTQADIEGKIIGRITCTELLTLRAGARIEGDIATGKLAVEPGAVFNGQCSMGAVIKEMHSKPQKVAAAK
ncbi:MAG TPA: polymer-forming cytoskeletal protein [Luteibaculaceae bacterium]|nr:polymer-forming cytoskeletal protein [Luteibaculaceae bacterium]